MSNAEMPPLAAGQVWVDDERVFLIGEKDYRGCRRFTLARSLRMMEPSACPDEEVRSEYLAFYRARLIHGPGAPWSPAEEVPHA